MAAAYPVDGRRCNVSSVTELPSPLRWAVRLLVVEAVGAGLAAAFLTYQGIVDDAANLGDALAVAGFAVVTGGVLAGLALALSRRKPRARAPAIVLQLLAVMFGYALLTGGVGWLGLLVGLLGLAVATLLLTPGSTGALTGGR
jgi:hypothetical protein